MHGQKKKALNKESKRRRALSRWENEGGATASGHKDEYFEARNFVERKPHNRLSGIKDQDV